MTRRRCSVTTESTSDGRRIVAAALILLGVLAACTRNNRFIDEPAGPDPNPVVEALMQQHARDALAQWDTTVAESGRTPVYAPTYGVEIVNDSAPVLDAHVLDGRPSVLAAQVPFELSPTVLTWPDGSSRPALGLTAKQAFDGLVKYTFPPLCVQCPAAHATGARLISRALPAVGGPVTVPAWEFTFAEFPDHVIVPAVHPDEVLLPVPATDGDREGIAPDKAWTDADGRRLVLQFLGPPGDARVPCGMDYTVEPVFSDFAVVVILHTHRYHPPSGQPDRAIMCPQSGVEREIGVTLPQPLGGRVLLDVRYGQRIPLFRSIQ
jgi:hypothetical protein